MALELVRIQSHDTRDFDFRWDGESYPIPAGGEAIIPFAAAKLYLGDPGARDIDKKRRNRTAEYARLRVKYGAYDDEAVFEEARPKVTTTTMTGQTLSMVADDPYGSGQQVAFEQPSESDLLALIRKQQEQIDQLIAQSSQPISPDDPLPPAPDEHAGQMVAPVVVTDPSSTPAPAAEPGPVHDGPPVDEPTKPKTGPRQPTKPQPSKPQHPAKGSSAPKASTGAK